MGFRITTNMMMNTYRYNLMNSTKRRTDSSDKVLTHRNFNSYAEDPAAATQAFRLRRNWYQTANQNDNNEAIYQKFNTAWHNVGGIITNLANPMAKVAVIRGNSDTAGESRTALAQVLRQTADSTIQSLNQPVGDQFIFAGNDGLHAPFSWSEDGKTLYYRGVNVNAGNVPEPGTDLPAATKTAWGALDEFGVPENMPSSSGDETEQAWIDYYNDQGDLAKLKKMSVEQVNIDLGMGLQEDENDVIINGTAFNSALAGINFVDYGVDEDGDPKNLALLMKDLASVFETWGENGQKYLPEKYRDMSADELKAAMEADPAVKEEIEAFDAENQAKAMRLMDKLKIAQENTTEKYVELSARSSFLQANGERLSTQQTNLNEQVLDIEQVDLADAITQFSWDMYCYNAALKIGNQLLSQSLIDYMN